MDLWEGERGRVGLIHVYIFEDDGEHKYAY